MAEALVRGIINSELYTNDTILVCEPDEKRREFLQSCYRIGTFADNQKILNECKVIILAVKPQIMQKVLTDCRGQLQSDQLLVSIAAGLPLSFYSNCLGSQDLKIIRVMPNTPALVLEGAAALSRNKNVSDRELDLASSIFSAVGKAVILEESHLDAVTGLSGSGPAYVFSFAEALIDAGVKIGLPRDTSEALALQTIAGSIKLLQESGEHPAALRAKVSSPGGTTISGLHVLEKEGFQGIIMDAVEAAFKRSIELGKAK